MNWARRILAFGFGGVFVYAGARKLWDPGLFLIDIRSFDLLPDPFAAWLALVLPWVEVLAGLAIMTGVFRRGGLVLLNAALVTFFIALGIAQSRGLSIQCGCFGGHDTTADYLELFLRDGALLLVGITLMRLWRFKPA